MPATMKGIHLVGNGGLDQLDLRDDIPVPEPKPKEVLVKVAACGMNNTDINTRTAWYRTFPLSEIRTAQAEFLRKQHVGYFVILP